MNNALLKFSWITVVTMVLSACSLMSPVKTDPATLYLLKTVPSVSKHKTHSMSLLITPMDSSSTYNSAEMIYTMKPYRIGYFAKHRWVQPPAQMLQPLVVESFQRSHFFHAIGSGSVVGHYDYVLNTQLLEMQQSFTEDSSYVHIVLRAQLVNFTTGKIMGSWTFRATEPATEYGPVGGVMALNAASAQVIRQLTLTCIHTLE